MSERTYGLPSFGVQIMVSPGADARLEICNPDSLIKELKDSTAI